MQINVDVHATQLILRLRNGERRLAYAVVNAINATAKRVQAAEHENVRERFTIRRPTFFFGTPARPGGTAARIDPFANVKQGRAYAEIAVRAPKGRGGVSRQTLLPYFEQGGTRPIFTPGAKRFAAPFIGGPARPTFASKVPPSFTFARLRFAPFTGGQKQTEEQRADPERERLTQWKGRLRTFIAINPGGGGAVLQRIGKKRGDVRAIYTFQRPTQLDSRLRFLETAQRVSDVWFREELEREAVKAVEHSRGSGL